MLVVRSMEQSSAKILSCHMVPQLWWHFVVAGKVSVKCISHSENGTLGDSLQPISVLLNKKGAFGHRHVVLSCFRWSIPLKSTKKIPTFGSEDEVKGNNE